MKLIAMIAAGLMAVTGVAPLAVEAPAGAQTTVVRETTTVTRSGPRYAPRRNYYRRGYATRRVCTNRWRNGHRVRVCRTVRYRR